MTKSVRFSIATCSDDDQYEWHDVFPSSSSHVFRFSIEERHRLIAPSWFTSKNIEDDDGEDDDIVQEVIEQSVRKEFGFSNDDFISRAYEKSVSDFISNVGFLSNDVECVKFIEDEFFGWVEKEMTDVFYLTVYNVKIVVLIREETDGEEFTGDEFDGEFKPVVDVEDDEEEVEMVPVDEVDQEVIEIEDDEEEEEVPVVEEEEEDGDGEVRGLMETVFGSNDYMEVEEPDDQWFMEDDDEGGGIEEQWWEGFVEEEDNWFGFSNRNGVSRDMIETSMKTREYDRKRDEDCMICMDGFSSKQEEIAEMPCSHVFHKPCIVEWLELKNSCPLCRFEICNKDDDPH